MFLVANIFKGVIFLILWYGGQMVKAAALFIIFSKWVLSSSVIWVMFKYIFSS